MTLMATEKPAEFEPSERSRTWEARAGDLLEEALYQIREGKDDVIPIVDAALAALRIAVGELPDSEFDCMSDEQRPCVCPPDLRRRGGFSGDCPAHSSL